MDMTLSQALEKLVNSIPAREGELSYFVLSDQVIISTAGDTVAGALTRR